MGMMDMIWFLPGLGWMGRGSKGEAKIALGESLYLRAMGQAAALARICGGFREGRMPRPFGRDF